MQWVNFIPVNAETPAEIGVPIALVEQGLELRLLVVTCQGSLNDEALVSFQDMK